MNWLSQSHVFKFLTLLEEQIEKSASNAVYLNVFIPAEISKWFQDQLVWFECFNNLVLFRASGDPNFI